MRRIIASICFSFCFLQILSAQNQTTDVSPIFPATDLPFDVKIKEEKFQLPFGVQDYVFAKHGDKWLILAGRMNGLHGFEHNPDNFPPNQQNPYVGVLDLRKKTFIYKSLDDPTSGLTQDQIDSLKVTAPQFYQSGQTLYMSGGYGFQTSTLQFITWPVLTAIDVPGLIHWVAGKSHTAAGHIKQVSDPLLRVTGGYMDRIGSRHNDPTLLVFGQDFEGTYLFGTSTQVYTEQVRKFHIIDKKDTLAVEFINPDPSDTHPDFRRRDLNIVRVLRSHHGKIETSLVAFSGVFTLTGGIWNVPVTISKDGAAVQADPNDPETFKQGSNNYNSATIGLFSKKHNEMYTVMCGGLTYENFVNGVPEFDNEIPFTNQFTAIKIDSKGRFSQYLLNGAYPVIPSTGSHPGNTLLFGTTAQFLIAPCVAKYEGNIINLDHVKESKTIGYIVGGIQSTLPNTGSPSDSSASPYIFKVTLVPKKSCHRR